MLARILKLSVAVLAAAAVAGIVYHFRLWERDWSSIDDGWASLIGSAMGSFLAVVGALYVSKAEDRRQKKEFEDFVRVCVQNLVVQASYLEAMAREPHKIAQTPEVQVGIISIQLRDLTDALAVFDREIAHSKEGRYQIRREIIALDAMVSESRHYLAMSADPTQTLNNWHVGAYQIRQYAAATLKGFGWISPKPSAELIGETVKHTIAAWNRWNVPIHSNHAPEVADGNLHRKPLQHAHA